MIELVRSKLPEVVDLCRRFDVRQLELFGSANTGEFDPSQSDLDFIVELIPIDLKRDTDNYFGLYDALEDLFATKVDLLERQAITNPYLIRAIKNSRETLYAA